MVELDFGSTHVRRVRRTGRTFGSIIPSGDILPSPKTPNNKHLTNAQITMLKNINKKINILKNI